MNRVSTPSNWDEEMKQLREAVSARLQQAADTIVAEESEKILGRVRIVTHRDLSRGDFQWFIEKKTEE